MKHFAKNLLLSIACIAALLGGCASDAEPLVGSDVRDTEMHMVGSVEDVTVSLPFHVRLHDGEAGEVRIEGEDNLIALIAVEDFGDGRLMISSAADLDEIEQHQPIDLYLPYAAMVNLSMDGADIMMWDDPRYMPELME